MRKMTTKTKAASQIPEKLRPQRQGVPEDRELGQEGRGEQRHAEGRSRAARPDAARPKIPRRRARTDPVRAIKDDGEEDLRVERQFRREVLLAIA